MRVRAGAVVSEGAVVILTAVFVLAVDTVRVGGRERIFVGVERSMVGEAVKPSMMWTSTGSLSTVESSEYVGARYP